MSREDYLYCGCCEREFLDYEMVIQYEEDNLCLTCFLIHAFGENRRSYLEGNRMYLQVSGFAFMPDSEYDEN